MFALDIAVRLLWCDSRFFLSGSALNRYTLDDPDVLRAHSRHQGKAPGFATGRQSTTEPLLWLGCDESMLTEMREAVAGVNDYPTFTTIILDLGQKALTRHELLKGAYYLRLAEFFLLFSDPRKLPTRQRFVDLLLDHLQIAPSAYSRIS